MNQSTTEFNKLEFGPLPLIFKSRARSGETIILAPHTTARIRLVSRTEIDLIIALAAISEFSPNVHFNNQSGNGLTYDLPEEFQQKVIEEWQEAPSIIRLFWKTAGELVIHPDHSATLISDIGTFRLYPIPEED